MNPKRRKATYNCLLLLVFWTVTWIIGFAMLASGVSALAIPATLILVIGPYSGLILLN
jgi:hypothetical protein